MAEQKVRADSIEKVKEKEFSSNLKKYKYLYLLMIPGLLWYVLFHIVPLYGIVIGFQDYTLTSGSNIFNNKWVGFDNFKWQQENKIEVKDLTRADGLNRVLYKCPHCGKRTEIYSRITGYYRPVQNWNAGKTQEYKERKTYNIETSVLTHVGPLNMASAAQACDCAEALPQRTMLFTSRTCPNCKAACNALDNASIPYEKLMADEHMDLVQEYGIMQAPTLVVTGDDGVKQYRGVSQILEMIQKSIAKV